MNGFFYFFSSLSILLEFSLVTRINTYLENVPFHFVSLYLPYFQILQFELQHNLLNTWKTQILLTNANKHFSDNIQTVQLLELQLRPFSSIKIHAFDPRKRVKKVIPSTFDDGEKWRNEEESRWNLKRARNERSPNHENAHPCHQTLYPFLPRFDHLSVEKPAKGFSPAAQISTKGSIKVSPWCLRTILSIIAPQSQLPRG